MEFFKTFKQRKIEATLPVADVYTHDIFPNSFRVQVWHIILGVLGKYDSHNWSNAVYEHIHNFFLREIGTFSLKNAVGMNNSYIANVQEDFCIFFSQCSR